MLYTEGTELMKKELTEMIDWPPMADWDITEEEVEGERRYMAALDRIAEDDEYIRIQAELWDADDEAEVAA